MTSSYLPEFFSLAVIHFLAVVAPGPDFAVTIRQSVRFGHRAGIGTAIGIGAGISIHVFYTLLGVGALMQVTPWLLLVAELSGAGYLLYLGITFVRQAGQQIKQVSLTPEGGANSVGKSFALGFLTNATNPKATLFFLAIFTTVVSSSTPMSVQILYGGWMCFVNAGWFVLVSLLFASENMRLHFLRIGHWFERLMGILLILVSARLLWGALYS